MNDPTQEGPIRSRKETILDVATRLFAERGYDGASMNDVAERAGMRKASLFYHFASKDALYEAVLERLVARVGTAVAEAYGGEGSFSERLERAAEVATAVLGAHPFAARLLVREAMDWGPAIRGRLLDVILGVFEMTAAFFRAGQEAGAFVEGDPRQLVLSIAGTQVLVFAVGNVVERFAGVQPFDEAFVAARKEAVRAHVRRMVVGS